MSKITIKSHFSQLSHLGNIIRTSETFCQLCQVMNITKQLYWRAFFRGGNTMINTYIECNVKMLLLNFKRPFSRIWKLSCCKKNKKNNKCSKCTIDHPKREIRHGLNANNWKSSLPVRCGDEFGCGSMLCLAGY